MPTLLVTRRMSPELAARVAASVRGRRAASSALAPRALGFLRLALIGTIVAAIAWLVVTRRRAHQAFERERAAVVSKVQREATSLGPDERALPARVLPWLERCAGVYGGDWVADELRTDGALAATLLRPTVYVRGPLPSFGSAAATAEAARGSWNDAFVLCLLDPPAARTEQNLVRKARVAYAGGKRLREATGHVERLHEAIVGLPFLDPAWQRRVLAADDPGELGRLRQTFEHAPITAAKRAARAALLLFAMDEPADGPGPTELDGERARHVRVGLVDLTTQKLLFRLRRRVDPSWLSPEARAEYARGVGGCALAVDVRAGVNGAGP